MRMRTTLVKPGVSIDMEQDPQGYVQASLNRGKSVIYYQKECYRRSYSCPNTRTATPCLASVDSVVKSDSVASDVDESDLASSQGGSTNSLIVGGHTAAGDQLGLVSSEWEEHPEVFPEDEASMVPLAKPTSNQPPQPSAAANRQLLSADSAANRQLLSADSAANHQLLLADSAANRQLLSADSAANSQLLSADERAAKSNEGWQPLQLDEVTNKQQGVADDAKVCSADEKGNFVKFKLQKGKLIVTDMKCVQVLMKRFENCIKEGSMRILQDHIGEKKKCYLFVPDSDKYLEIMEGLLESLPELENAVANVDVQPQEEPTPEMNF